MKATALDLRYHTKILLDRVRSGESIEISHRGQTVALLTPLPQGEQHTKKTIPAFGMWADRSDMQNPAEFVRELRRSRF